MSAEFRLFSHFIFILHTYLDFFLLNLSVWLVVMVYLSKIANYG